MEKQQQGISNAKYSSCCRLYPVSMQISQDLPHKREQKIAQHIIEEKVTGAVDIVWILRTV